MNIKKRFYSFLNRNVFIKSISRGGRYRVLTSPAEIKSFQIERFNIIWNDAFNNIPFYREWKKKYDLPDKISDLAELDNWPTLAKINLQEIKKSLLRDNVKPTGYIKTGGSTGEPLHIPTWKDTETSPSMWLGRAAYGIEPGMKTFLIWGHHHLYGKGILRRINVAKRVMKDWLSNMKRVSAYDISEKAMSSVFKTYTKFHSELIIGFSASVLSFVRVNRKRNEEQNYKIKAVICTAGPLSVTEKEEISSFFNAPVCMEYGSAECGVMAYTEPSSNEYIVFWDTHLLQGIKDEFGEIKNIVTRLSNCYFPLIRYDIGDYLELENTVDLNSVSKIKTIKGRPSDIVCLNDGTTFFGAIIGDCVKQIQTVVANQLHVYQNGIQLKVVALQPLIESDLSLVKLRLTTVVPGLKKHNIIITQVDQLYKTIAGKTPLVVYNEFNL
ncbi:MAG: phenylacetate--CoA ligase family protein [Draconibacterium sp.]|nr:phenylacetate--CoA ligase family protein [Draconibacterium sp.]